MLIKYLSSRKIFQPERIKEKKSDIVTFGGLSFLIIFLFLSYYDFQLFVFCILIGLVGFYDDFLKVYNKDWHGMRSIFKLILEVVFCLIYLIFSYKFNFFILLWRIFVLVGTINAVNITDGIDSLSGVTCVFCLLFLYLKTGSLIPTIGISMLLSFLCFNFPPAKLYMGDVGSLSLGAFISALFIKNELELALPLVGFVFVLETLSSLIQIFSIRICGTRVFKMAPIHHHLFLKGWSKYSVLSLFHLLTITFFFISIALFC